MSSRYERDFHPEAKKRGEWQFAPTQWIKSKSQKIEVIV
jgi:hypothetical protein